MTISAIQGDSTDNFDITGRLLWCLFLSGFAATGFWEIWSSWPTHLVTGYPLEPPQLVKSLFRAQLGVEVPDVWAKALHYVTGVVFYPIGFLVLIRLKAVPRSTDGWLWGVITYFIALGMFAPLAGLPFLLIGDNIDLSIMSLIGHAVYGYILGAVFHPLQSYTLMRRG